MPPKKSVKSTAKKTTKRTSKKTTTKKLKLPEFKCEKKVSDGYRVYLIKNKDGEFPKNFKEFVKNVKSNDVKLPLEYFSFNQTCDTGESMEVVFTLNKDKKTEMQVIKNGKKSGKKQKLEDKESDEVLDMIRDIQVSTNDVKTPIMNEPLPMMSPTLIRLPIEKSMLLPLLMKRMPMMRLML